MQNNTLQSSLLKNYLASAGIASNTGVTQPLASVQNNMPKMQTSVQQDAFVPQAPKTEEEKEHKRHVAKIALAAGILIGTGAIIAAAFRNNGGLIKTMKGKGKEILNFFSSKGQEASDVIKNKTGEMPDFTAGADNITNVKDVGIRHFLKKIPFYDKFDKFTSDLYRNTIMKRIKGIYSKAKTSLDSADDMVLGALKKSNADEQTTQRISELIAKRSRNISEFASNEAVGERFTQLNDSMRDIDQSGWNKLKGFIKRKDLRGAMKNLSQESVVNEGLKKSKAFQDGIMSGFQSCGLNEAEASELSQLLERTFGDTNPEILKEVSKAEKGLVKAFCKEKGDLFLKLRDINCGSAPTDIESLAMTMGALGLYTAQADTKEEKVGVTLTTGIPLLTTVGTTLVATCNMISGVRALGMGATAGFVVKKICNSINKKYQEEHAQNGQPAPKTIVTLDDYTQTIKDMKNKIYSF